MNDRKKGAWPAAAAGIAFLSMLYIAAYFGLAVPIGTIRPAWRFCEDWTDPNDLTYSSRLDAFFWPLIRLDKRMVQNYQAGPLSPARP